VISVAAKMMALSLILSAGARGQEHSSIQNECSSLRNANSLDLVQFLGEVAPDEKNGDCVAWVINKLGEERYKPSITVLIKFLDFRRPPTQQEKQGIYLRMQGIWEIYPAAGALSLIGESALPEILRALEAEPTSPTARENAVFVWMEIYRQTDDRPKGIALLKQEQAKVSDQTIKQRLQWALQRAFTWCNPVEEDACRQAARATAP
jgi:hypothetical protein